MTALLPAPATPPAEPPAGLRWALADTWAVALRSLLRWLRRPEEVLVGLLFPVLLLLMFGYLFGGAMTVPGADAPGGGDYREFLVPGLFALMMFFGVEATVLAVAADAAAGITDRFRSLPMSASAVVGGRAVADMVTSVAGLAVLLGAGLLVAGGTGVAGLLAGGDVLQSAIWQATLPVLGDVKLVTSLFFDMGVYLIVVGLVLDVLRSLGAELDRQEDEDDPIELNEGEVVVR